MKSAVIIGAGIVGLCTADALNRRGIEVTVIDRDPSPVGASHGNGGIIVPSHFVPLAAPGMIAMGMRMALDLGSPFGFTRPDLATAGWAYRFMRHANKAHVERTAPLIRDLNLASRELYQELVDRLGLDVGWGRRGLLMLCRSDAALKGEAHLAEDAKRLGLTAHVVGREDIARLEPDLLPEALGGVLFEDDAHLTPGAMMPALRQRLAEAGVRFQIGSPASGFATEGDKIRAVRIGGQEIAADGIVVANGVHAGELLRSLEIKLPLLSGRGYGFTLPDPPAKPQRPAILVEARVAVTPVIDGIRFVGTMELGVPAERTSPRRIERMKESIRAAYPDLAKSDLDAPPVWGGDRPCLPDGLPAIGHARRWRNLTVATGHAMMGMSLGPISGELAAEDLLGEPTRLPIDQLSPNRFI